MGQPDDDVARRLGKFRRRGWWCTDVELSEALSLDLGTLAAWRAAGTGPPWWEADGEVRYDFRDALGWLAQQHIRSQDPEARLARRLRLARLGRP